MYKNIFYNKGNNTLHLWDDKKGYYHFPYRHYAYVKHPAGSFKTLAGENVRKQDGWSKEDLDAGKVFESDVQPEMRTLIDLYYESDEVSTGHINFFFDIEVEKGLKYSKVEDADNRITSICYYTNTDKKYVVFILDELCQVKTIDNDNVNVTGYATEKELLKAFLVKYQSVQPTIISGWNSSGFDVPYLYNRLRKVFSERVANGLSPIGIVKYNERDETYQIAGVSHLDYLLLYKNFKISEKPSYTLEAIAMDELGYGKIKYDGDLDHLYKTDIMQFIKYNMVDVKILKELDDKKQYIDLVKNTCHKGHVPYESIFQTSVYLDGAALVYTKALGIVAPNKKHPKKLIISNDHNIGSEKLYVQDVIPEDLPKSGNLKVKKSKTSDFRISYDSYKDNYFVLTEPIKQKILGKYDLILDLAGAYVQDPVPGLHDWMYDLDLTSLYPSIIITLNISPETKMGRVINWDVNKYLRKEDFVFNVAIKKSIVKVNAKDFETWIKDKNYSIASNGVMYTLDRKGLIPAILERWFDERVEYKNLMKKFGKEKNEEKYQYYFLRQWTQKILLNSFYGVLGLQSFRYYSMDNAEAVTATGVSIIKTSASLANKYYNNIIQSTTLVDYITYIDTDSNFLSALPIIKHRYPDIDVNDVELMSKKVIEVATEVQGYINKSYDIYADKYHNVKDHKLFIKQELIGRTGVWFAKKRYAIWIINKEGVPVDELEVKGLDVVRSDFPGSFRTFLKDVLQNILNKHTKEQITDQIITFRNTLSEIPTLQLMFPTGVREMDKYQYEDRHIFEIISGTPIHVKSSIYYNDLLKYHKIDNIPGIYGGDKIKWTYLKKNPYNIDTCALKGFEDPQILMDFIDNYIDKHHNFESAFLKKLQDFYTALGWGTLVLNDSMNEFFSF